MRSRFFTLVLFISTAVSVWGARVDTLAVPSKLMKKSVETIVIVPTCEKTTYPVLYLLHGHGGNAVHGLVLSRGYHSWPISMEF